MAAHETSQARRVIALADRLEALLGKPVDILSSRAIRNPYFAQAVQRQRVALYDRA
jgi:predicted nucleotidyltransferase